LESALDAICRRKRLPNADADDFRQDFWLHLVEHDWDVLRRFRGDSEPATYYHVVVRNFFVNWLYDGRARWRPSAAARHIGPVALAYDRLTRRDGFTREQAIETLLAKDATLSRCGLETIADQVPLPRTSMVNGVAVSTPTAAEVLVEQRDRRRRRAVTGSRLRAFVAARSDEERRILHYWFVEDLEASAIANILHLSRPQIYRRVAALKAELTAALLAAGIGENEAEQAIVDGLDLNLLLFKDSGAGGE
jgi:RNA polymerase sigma factor for flagellar operon FliA